MARLTEVAVFTKPDTLYWADEELQYQRIVAARHRGRISGIHEDLSNTSGLAKNLLYMPKIMGQRLLEGIQLVQSESVNCHRFSQHMIGLKSVDYRLTRITDAYERASTPLHLGELGLVGTFGKWAAHSVIGLGGEVPESLQVMSIEGEIGIANNSDIVDFYGNHNLSVAIYRAV